MVSKEADEFTSIHPHISILFSISLYDLVARNGAVGSRTQQYDWVILSPPPPTASLALTELSNQDLAYCLVISCLHTG